MNLGEIKDYTAAMIGISDTATKTQAGEFAKARWRMIWNSQPWRQARWQQTVAVSSGTQDVTLQSQFEFATHYRWDGQTELMPVAEGAALAMNPQGFDQAGAVTSVAQLGKDSSGNVVLRLFGIPTESKNLLVLGKRKCVELSANSDTPLLPGVDECLCAFTLGDLYRWQRQFTKADRLYGEANALLAKMVEIEVAQSGGIQRVIPQEQVLDDSPDHSWLKG